MSNPNWIDGKPVTYRELLSRDDRLVMSLAEVAKLLSVSVQTVRLYTRKGWLFAPDTAGGRVLITKESLYRFLTEGPPKPEPSPVSPETSVSPPPVSRKKVKDHGFNLQALRRRRTG